MILLKLAAATLLLVGSGIVFWAQRLFDQEPEPSAAPRARSQVFEVECSTERRAA